MKLKQILTWLLVIISTCSYAQYCTTGCNDNTYVNSGNPNTIEYDNLISTFHSSLVKENDGVFKIWGEGTASNGVSNLLSPTSINNSNGFNYTGTPLRVAGGSRSNTGGGMAQFALLTTDGLYFWGGIGSLISSSILNTTNFAKVNIGTLGIANASNPSFSKGLPAGVEPTNVKMMFGSYKTLTIVTCNGEAWVISTNGSKNGDGTTQGSGSNDYVWHRVKTSAIGNPNLTDVVALRGTPNALFALTSTGKLYTWGTGTYINSGIATNRTYATEVTIPADTTPKMIGMTQGNNIYKYQTYYLLATNGKLYAMGSNQNKQLGDGTTTESTTWKEVTASYVISGTTYNLGGNIVWISPNEHDDQGYAAINVLTTNKKQWAWGSNSGYMIGGASAISYDPFYMPGNSTATEGLNINDNVIALETGGHTTINIKECSNYFGYVGHKIFGSMGDGTNDSSNPNTYSYKTALLVVCGTDILAPKINNTIKICPSNTANLDIVNLEVPLSQIEWHTGNTRASSLVTNPNAVSAGTYYAFFTDISGKCQDVFSEVTVSYLQPGDTGYDTCSSFICPPDPYAAQQTWWLANGFRTPIHPVIIDFNTGSPVLTTPSTGYGNGFPAYYQTNGLGYEGNTTVTHPVTGEFLFATDGNTLFRGSDGAKATGTNVGGGLSAGEAAAVIPDPNGILGRNFLILGNSSWNTPGGLNMSKYDLTTNTLTNLTTLLPNGSIYEGLEVIPHTNGNDYWILVNTTDQKVKTYLYSKSSGFNSTPVSSTDVTNLTGVNSSYIAVNSFISWDPRTPGKLLIARHNKVGLANFDPSTGTLDTWEVKITYSTGSPDNDSSVGYSVALSPNGRYIYYAVDYDKLMYYDLQTSTSSQLATVTALSGVKIGPDNKLYVVGYPSFDTGLYYYATPDSPSSSTSALPLLNTNGYTVPLQLPNNVYWGCMTCQSGTAAPTLANTNITSNPSTVGDLIALLSASNKPAGTVITIHSSATATDANKLANSTAIVAGTTYYAAFYDGLAICYSPTTAVTVGTTYCYKPAVLDAGNTYPTKHGITSLGRAGTDSDNWPMVRQSAWTALESKTKGFVVNRVKFNASNQPVADDGTTLVITSPVEGMMVYDTTNNCLKVYTSNNGGSTFAWHCMSTQACPQ